MWSALRRLFAAETANVMFLMAAAAAALLLANSPWRTTYTDLWHLQIFTRDLHFWVNDGLMAIFFFVVGLEMRRAIHSGVLSTIRTAMLPCIAAAGGMLAPALLFAGLNLNRSSAAGWAVPVATDIAFAVGVLTLLGRRVPRAARLFLLALAVIDDIGAVIVIGLFYSDGFAPLGLVVILLGVLMTVAMRKIGVHRLWLYVAPAIVVWIGMSTSGLHPTMSGVLMGFLIPGRFEKLEHALQPWIAFGVLPVFAFANAGVSLGEATFSGDALWSFWGIFGGLVLGKPIGVLALSWLAVRSGLAALPNGIGWLHVGLIGVVAGIGFTMALFIAELAFAPGPLLETAKLAILCASATAALLALLIGCYSEARS